MRIGIPVDEKDPGAMVSASFGRAPYFLIYETETKTATYADNTALSSPGGAGLKAAQMIVDGQVEVVLTPRCGKNAAEVLHSAGIKLFKTTLASAKESIDAFAHDQLPLLEDIHAGFHGHGGE